MDQRTGERAACAHPTAEAADDRAAAIPEADDLERLANPAVDAVDGGEKAEILLDRQVRVQCGLLGHVADVGEDIEVWHPPVEHGHRSLLRLHEADQASN